MNWENKAKILYESTVWLARAVAAGKAIDNKLNGEPGKVITHCYWDMAGYLAHFEYEVLVRRGVINKLSASLKP